MHLYRTSFLTVDSPSAFSEIKIRGSRFIGQVFHIESAADFDSIYRQIKTKYVNASHYCYAYRISADLYHYYDDGEPFGTAGRPLYHVLEGQNLFQVLLIVIRYFGGTKLGRNGLVRAYTRSARETLARTKIIKKIFYKIFRLSMSYAMMLEVMRLVKKYEGLMSQADYQQRVGMLCHIPEDRYREFQTDLQVLNRKEQLEFELIENICGDTYA